MQAKKGGYAVQLRYKLEGRDPTAKASRVRQARQGKPVKFRPDYPNLVPQNPYQAYKRQVLEEPREARQNRPPAVQSWSGISPEARAFYRQAGLDRERKARGWG